MIKVMRWCFVFLISILVTACASANATSPAPGPVVSSVGEVATQAVQPVAKATSRGDKLEASAPASVTIGAGRTVLVEFFRFT